MSSTFRVLHHNYLNTVLMVILEKTKILNENLYLYHFICDLEDTKFQIQFYIQV